MSVLRQYYALGARYMTLTHTCNNAFAGSSGQVPGHFQGDFTSELGEGHRFVASSLQENMSFDEVHRVSPLGRTLIREMNRLGMLVDLSHVSDATALDAIAVTRAPVIWSHSSARALRNIPRNVPDFVLEKIGEGKGKIDGVVMVSTFTSVIALRRPWSHRSIFSLGS